MKTPRTHCHMTAPSLDQLGSRFSGAFWHGFLLGRVDELDQDETDGDGDEGGEVGLGLFAA